jgi:hypothetical protein
MRSSHYRLALCGLLAGLAGCIVSNAKDGAPGTVTDSGQGGVDGGADGGIPLDDVGLLAEVGVPESGPGTGTAEIYVSSDTELWQMDPTSKSVTKIGAFDFGSATKENITDVAVNGDGAVWVNSATKVYQAAIPAGGTGAVALTLKLTLPSTSRFYALGFAPAGVLEGGEGLVAGDSLGDLYYIPSSSPTPTLQKLGSFGPCKAGDPPQCKTGDHWELSGDVVFYSVNGAPKGLASLRACTKPTSAGVTTCDNTNDAIAEIDMTALAAKSPTSVLRKQILGQGTSNGRVYGLGAWGNVVYGFTLADAKSSTPASLVSIGAAGAGTVLQSFPAVTNGWSGAGVSTKATITVIQ